MPWNILGCQEHIIELTNPDLSIYTRMREYIHFTVYLPADRHFYFKYLFFEWEWNKLHRPGRAEGPKLGEAIIPPTQKIIFSTFFFLIWGNTVFYSWMKIQLWELCWAGVTMMQETGTGWGNWTGMLKFDKFHLLGWLTSVLMFVQEITWIFQKEEGCWAPS